MSELANRVPEITSTGPFEVEENRTSAGRLENGYVKVERAEGEAPLSEEIYYCRVVRATASTWPAGYQWRTSLAGRTPASQIGHNARIKPTFHAGGSRRNRRGAPCGRPKRR